MTAKRLLRRRASLVISAMAVMLTLLAPASAQELDDAASVALVESAVAIERDTSNGVPPIRISIPAIGLDTNVIPVGMDSDGAMAAPDNPDTVAWYALGPGLGVGGNVVLAGHVDWDGRPRAFGYLRNLADGDVVTVWDQDGAPESFTVVSSHWVEAEGADTEEIFALTDIPTITLITCGGAYDPFSRQYLHRLIVKAVLATDEN